MAGDNDPKSSAFEDNNDEDLYYDPFSEEDLLNVIRSPNRDLMDLSFTLDPLLPPPPTPTTEDINETGLMQELSLSISNCETNEFLNPAFQDDSTLSWDMGMDMDMVMFDIPSDDFDDIISSNVLEEIGNDNGNNVGETGRLEASTRVFVENGLNFETGGSSTMPAPSITPIISQGILLCTCCNLLRGIVHANGQEMMRLDIYGGIGYFCHAILETQRFDGSNERTHQTYHLMDLTTDEVRKFIEDYCAGREAGGFVITQDTNADFFQAMNACSCNNHSFMSTLSSRDDVPTSLAMPNEALNVPHVPRYVGLRAAPPVSKRRRTPLAAQRERTGKLTLKDISMHFHLPIEQAARKLSLCPTVVKKICRKGGLYRWPHRKIKSLLKKIDSLKSVVSTAKDDRVRMHAEQEIEKLERKINEICSEILKNFK